MTKIYTLITFLFFTISSLWAQNENLQLGNLSPEELKMEEYPSDKDAEAVVFFDLGKTEFYASPTSFDVAFKRTTRLKILKESGIKWAEIEIPYYQQGGIYEHVDHIEAYAYNINEHGQIFKTALDLSTVYEEKINEYWMCKKFAIPNVKKGTIIEYTYQLISPYKFNLQDWEFQWRIPVVYSEYEVKMIPFYEYTWLLQGASRFDHTESYQDRSERTFVGITYHDMVHKYTMKNLPAFDDEEFISSINDYIIKIDFQLAKTHQTNGVTTEVITTWDKMIDDMLKSSDFGKYVKKAAKECTKRFGNEINQLSTLEEKFDFAIDYAKQNFNWNGMNSKFASKSVGKLLDEKQGNCADINLFTIGMLNAMGIEANPLMISTRNHGKIKYDYPYAHFFNYIIIAAKIDNKYILSDATETMCLNNRIPERCINDRGLIVAEGELKWVQLGCKFPSQTVTNICYNSITEDEIISSINKSSTEYDALYYRKYYSDDYDEIKENIDSEYKTAIDSTIKVMNQDDKEKPYVLTYQQTSHPEIVNNKLYIAPFFDQTVDENPFKKDSRRYAIDMVYPKKKSYHSTIIIPEGYELDFVPAASQVKSDLYELSYNANVDGNTIDITFNYYLKSGIYAANKYKSLKMFYNLLVKKGNEKVVIKKKVDDVGPLTMTNTTK